MGASPVSRTNFRERTIKLACYCEHVIGHRAMVEQLLRHKHRENLFNVRVGLTVLDRELVVNHEHRKTMIMMMASWLPDMPLTR